METFPFDIEKYRSFLGELEQPDFRFMAVLINRKSKERGKKDILNDIRSFKGVTIVAVKEADDRMDTRVNDYSEISVKVDRFPLGHASVRTIVDHLSKEINKLDGVVKFELLGMPETI
jgi:hypothetical protein